MEVLEVEVEVWLTECDVFPCCNNRVPPYNPQVFFSEKNPKALALNKQEEMNVCYIHIAISCSCREDAMSSKGWLGSVLLILKALCNVFLPPELSRSQKPRNKVIQKKSTENQIALGQWKFNVVHHSLPNAFSYLIASVGLPFMMRSILIWLETASWYETASHLRLK